MLAVTLASGALCWSYWPIFGELLTAWQTEPDYSHGFLVVPVSILFLWARRSTVPQAIHGLAWGGAALLLFSVVVRVLGSIWYIDSMQAWSLPICLAGICWFLGGRPLLKWSLPAIVFLGFMIPLPFRAERLLSLPLQRVATHLSCWLLQCLGQPAVSEGNVVVIHEVELEVVEACSGLRILVSIAALAFAFAVLVKRPWWCKLGLFASILPVALAVNALRIAMTGLLAIHISGEAAHKFSHDLAGLAMMPTAGILLGLVSWYLGRAFVEARTVTARDLVLRGGAR